MKVGTLVALEGTLWSSYDREDQIGVVLETDLADAPELSRVWWSKDNQTKLYKTEHLVVIG